MFKSLIGLVVFFTGFSAAAVTTQIKTVEPVNQEWGRMSVQLPARSINQYSPLIICDSLDFQMSHFSSVFDRGMLLVELRYQMINYPLGTSCTVFFSEDDLTEFDFASGQPLLSAPQAFKFVVQN